MKHFHIAACVAAGTQINQMVDQELDPQTQELVEAYDGQVDATFAAVMTQMTTMRMTSTALATALGTVGIGGLGYSTSGDPVDFYWQPGVSGGTRDTTACVKASSAQGMIVLDGIEAAEGQAASASLMAYPLSTDGVASPLVITTGVTLPSQTMTRNVHTVGPVKINGTLVEGVLSSSLRFGLQVAHETESGGAYATFANIAARRAVFTVRTRNVELVSSLGLHAAQSTVSKSTIYFRKVAPGGTRVPNATAQHISLAVSAGIILTRRVPAQNGQPAAVDIEIPVIWDGTNAPIIVNTATAIT